MVRWKTTSAVTGAILSICISWAATAASAGTSDAASTPSSKHHSADVILTSGHILTEDPRASIVEALAIRDGRLIALGTNAQILPLATPLPARLGLWASVARQTLHGSYGAQPFGTAEAIGAGDALKSYTVWAAHQLFLEAEAGSLEPGKSADIAVWDQDPLTAPTAALENLKCELTLFRGAVVYQAAATSITITNAKHHATK